MQLFVKKSISQDVELFQITCVICVMHIHTNTGVVSTSQNAGIHCSRRWHKLK